MKWWMRLRSAAAERQRVVPRVGVQEDDVDVVAVTSATMRSLEPEAEELAVERWLAAGSRAATTTWPSPRSSATKPERTTRRHERLGGPLGAPADLGGDAGGIAQLDQALHAARAASAGVPSVTSTPAARSLTVTPVNSASLPTSQPMKRTSSAAPGSTTMRWRC